MKTQLQEYYWEAFTTCNEYAHEDRFTIDVYVKDPRIIQKPLELTREDLESMLSALDNLEKS